MQNTKFVSQKYNNYQYAPGIALYGIDGKAGISGTNGTSLFICVYDINNDEDRGKFGNAIRHGNTMNMEEPKSIGRNYTVGDSFLFPDGKIYSIKKGEDDNVTQYLNILISAGDNLTPDEFDECMEFVGRIAIENQNDRFRKESNRLVLDTDSYKGFVINNSDSDDIGDIEAPLTIIGSTKTGSNGIERYLDIKSIQTGMSDAQFKIFYDENNNTYVIDSDRPIRIDANLSVSKSSSSAISGYSSISTSETPITSFKGVCEHTSFSKDNGSVVYEYHVTEGNTTSQVYDRTAVVKDIKRVDIDNVSFVDGENGIKFLRYNTFIKYGEMNYRKATKLSVHLFMDNNIVTDKPILILFTNTNSEGYEQPVDTDPVYIMNNGVMTDRMEAIENKVYIPYSRHYWLSKSDNTNQIWVPSEADKFIIIMPSELNSHIMVFAEDLPGHEINVKKEEENFEKLTALFDGTTGKFPVNVLQTSTSHYYRTFCVKFVPEERQVVPSTVLPTMVHIKGILNGCVAIEFYKNIRDDVAEGGFEIYITIDSYQNINAINDWLISLIGITEIEIEENEQ